MTMKHDQRENKKISKQNFNNPKIKSHQINNNRKT